MYVLRFFRVVMPLPALMVGAFAVTATGACLLTLGGAVPASTTLRPVVLLQLFAASSGFMSAARRGHYDLLLSRGEPRVRIALAHWLMSVTPGIASWLCIGAAEAAARETFEVAALSGGVAAAMALVSTIPWALTVALPRFSGAIGWLLVAATVAPFDAWPGSAAPPGPAGPAPLWSPATLSRPLDVLSFPLRVFGDAQPDMEPVAMTPLIVAGVLMAAALAWIHRTEIPLEAAQ